MLVAGIVAACICTLAAAIWLIPTLRMAVQSILDLGEESASIQPILADLERSRHRRICFRGTAVSATPFPVSTPDDPLSFLLEGFIGQVQVKLANGEQVDLMVLADARDADAASLPLPGTAVRVCGFPSEHPAAGAADSPRLLLMGSSQSLTMRKD